MHPYKHRHYSGLDWWKWKGGQQKQRSGHASWLLHLPRPGKAHTVQTLPSYADFGPIDPFHIMTW